MCQRQFIGNRIVIDVADSDIASLNLCRQIACRGHDIPAAAIGDSHLQAQTGISCSLLLGGGDHVK